MSETRELTADVAKKLRKHLKNVYFHSIATSTKNWPQATMVQPVLVGDWELQFIANKHSKKVRNLQENPNAWMITDSTGMFKIPKVIYSKGKAEVVPLTESLLTEFLSHHGWFSKMMLKRMAEDTIADSVIVKFHPSRFITVGHFGGMGTQVAFNVKE